MLPAPGLAGVCDVHCEAVATRVAEHVRRDEEIASVRTGIATLDQIALTAYGRQNRALARCGAADGAATAATRVKSVITAGRTWWSRTVQP